MRISPLAILILILLVPVAVQLFLKWFLLPLMLRGKHLPPYRMDYQVTSVDQLTAE
jgi:hypothetical protein